MFRSLLCDHLRKLMCVKASFIVSRHLACEEDRLEEAKMLISKGASLDIQNRDEKIPLELCSAPITRQLEEFASK